MEKSISKIVCKSGFYLCWVIILSISFIYASSTTDPSEKRVFNTVTIPNIDPLIHLDTEWYVLPQYMYNFRYKHVPPNEYLIQKSENFYSQIGTEAYYKTFYRPDFEQYPLQTGLILFFRITTFLCLVISLFLLAKIFHSGYSDNLLFSKNPHRLFYIGFAVFLLPILRISHSIVLAGFIRLDPQLLGYKISPSYQSSWIMLAGVLIIIVSFAYKELIRLYEEQKLTV